MKLKWLLIFLCAVLFVNAQKKSVVYKANSYKICTWFEETGFIADCQEAYKNTSIEINETAKSILVVTGKTFVYTIISTHTDIKNEEEKDIYYLVKDSTQSLFQFKITEKPNIKIISAYKCTNNEMPAFENRKISRWQWIINN